MEKSIRVSKRVHKELKKRKANLEHDLERGVTMCEYLEVLLGI